MNLNSIAEYLTGETDLAIGRTLFSHFLPADVTVGVMLRNTPVGTQINPEVPDLRKAPFQVIVRDTDFAHGAARADEISKVLNFLEKELTGMATKYMRPRTEPYAYPLSAGNLWEFMVNFDCCYVVLPE